MCQSLPSRNHKVKCSTCSAAAQRMRWQHQTISPACSPLVWINALLDSSMLGQQDLMPLRLSITSVSGVPAEPMLLLVQGT